MTAPDARLPLCQNCNAPLSQLEPPPEYCPRCGQETTLHPPTFFEFVHEFVSHYVAAEGALWRTLGALLLRPGKLTREYLAGRRRRYVLPLRLYLTASFLFFLVVKVLGTDSSLEIQIAGADQRDGTPTSVVEQAQSRADFERLSLCAAAASSCGRVDRAIARFSLRLMEGAGDAPRLQQRLASALPYAVFLMLPLFAGLMRLAYRNRGMNYGAHFVFGLHLHALWFFVLLLLAAQPGGADLWALGAVGLYALTAMRHVYGGRWWTTLSRGAFVSASYLLCLALGSGLLLVLALWLR